TVSASTKEYGTLAKSGDRPAGTAQSAAADSRSATTATETTNSARIGETEWNDPTTNRPYQHLAAKSGTEFDREYIPMTLDDHEDDVALFEKEAKGGSDVEVKSFAATGLPKLREHLSRAQQIKTRLKSS